MKTHLTALTAVLAFAASACDRVRHEGATQDTAPMNLKGHWIGTSESIVRGSAMHHAAQTGNTPLLDNVRFDFNFVGQDGRRFWGTVTSPTGQEPIMGVIAYDGKTIVAEDTDGTLQGRIVNGDTIDAVYSHITPTSTVVAANKLIRQK